MTEYAQRELTKELRRISKEVINGYEHITKPDHRPNLEWPHRKLNLKFMARKDRIKGGNGTKDWGSYELIVIAAGETYDLIDFKKGYRLRNIRTILGNNHLPQFASRHVPEALRGNFPLYQELMAKGRYKEFVSSVSDSIEKLLGEIKEKKYGSGLDIYDSLKNTR